jgi:hypothetical protein
LNEKERQKAVADELAKTLERIRPMFGDDELFDTVLEIYRQNPLLKQMLPE